MTIVCVYYAEIVAIATDRLPWKQNGKLILLAYYPSKVQYSLVYEGVKLENRSAYFMVAFQCSRWKVALKGSISFFKISYTQYCIAF